MDFDKERLEPDEIKGFKLSGKFILNEWIFVEYKVPPENEEVLVWDGKGFWLCYFHKGYWVGVCHKLNKEDPEVPKPIYWMRLLSPCDDED